VILPILFAVVTRCGVTFDAPDGWRTSVEKIDDAAIACRINLDPPKWPEPKHSRWGGPEHPFKIEIYTPSTTYDQALEKMGFEKDEEGRVGIFGFRSVFEEATPWHMGKLRGVIVDPFYRGYIQDESLLRKDEERVYSTVEYHIVAKTAGRWIGIECDSGTPDASVDCDAVLPLVARGLRFSK
jgi:hypothetical protein